MSDRTTVAVLAPYYPPAFRGGGPVRSISALVDSASHGYDAFVLTADSDMGASAPLPVPRNVWTRQQGSHIYYASLASTLAYVRGLLALRRRRPTLLHLNSFMNPRLSVVPILLWRLRFWGSAKLLLSPRGEFGDGALARRALKKRIYIFLFRVLGISRSVAWHSTAPHETIDIRRIWGDSALIIERSNDTLLPRTAVDPVPVNGSLRAVFLGRIVEHKGLHIALRALSGVKVPVDLSVYGSPEDPAYFRRCEEIARELPLHISVTFHGPIDPGAVIPMLAEHELLLMPTAGENFGHVIAEALSASCAVAVTPYTPWTETLAQGGGFILQRAEGPWSRAIEDRASSSRDERLRARRSAGEAYERWRAQPQPPHVWELAMDAFSAKERVIRDL